MIQVPEKPLVPLHQVTVRFAGDSGDGMQLVGSQFADLASILGNALSTLADFPSEIRPPAGSLGGVSSFQISFGDRHVHTPGDAPQVLVAMNPAALRVSLPDLEEAGIIILDEDQFTEKNLHKAGYEHSPLEDDSLRGYRVVPISITRLNREALKKTELPQKSRDRCKNFLALGILLWLFDRPMDPVLNWLKEKFAKHPDVLKANSASLRAGYNFANTAEILRVHYHVSPTHLQQGRYRRVTGNEAMALGFVAAARRAARPLVYASYPITPASEILHELSRLKRYDVRTVQAEDEIAACCAAIGASYGGAVGVTATSGPGLSLKSEAIGLAVMAELPLVVVDVQRAGPSTGMPTRTEQSDLLQALYGRHGECPLVVLAVATPSHGFSIAFEAVRIAVNHMTPVIILSDSFLASSAEPWRLPTEQLLPEVNPPPEADGTDYKPYQRDPETLARTWVTPGTPGREHRVGGLEKEDVSGVVTYDGKNHEKMIALRAEKIERITKQIPPLEVRGPGEGDVLVVGWGSTYGACLAAAEEYQTKGARVGHLHLRYLNPLPSDLGQVLSRYKHVLVAENNRGHLRMLLRSKYLIDARGINRMTGRPMRIRDVKRGIEKVLGGTSK